MNDQTFLASIGVATFIHRPVDSHADCAKCGGTARVDDGRHYDGMTAYSIRCDACGLEGWWAFTLEVAMRQWQRGEYRAPVRSCR